MASRNTRNRLSSPALLALTLALAAPATHPPFLQAQEHEPQRPAPGPPVLELVTSTRALALGGAFWTPGGGSHAIFHHPALIPGRGFGIAIGGTTAPHGDHQRDHDSRDHEREHGGREGDDDDGGHDGGDGDREHGDGDRGRAQALQIALGASGSWLGGTVGIGLVAFDHDAGFVPAAPPEHGRGPGERDDEDDRDDEHDRDHHEEGAWAAATEFVGAVGYAREVFGFGVGAAAKVVGRRSEGSRARTVAVDVGVAREIGPVSAALTVRNLGRDMRMPGRRVPLPWQVALGAGVGREPVGPLDIGGAVHVTREGGGEIVPGGGVEIAYWPVQRRVFVVRIGGARVVEGDGLPLTLGAGFEGDRIRLDYAFSDHDPISGPHRIGVSIR